MGRAANAALGGRFVKGVKKRAFQSLSRNRIEEQSLLGTRDGFFDHFAVAESSIAAGGGRVASFGGPVV